MIALGLWAYLCSEGFRGFDRSCNSVRIAKHGMIRLCKKNTRPLGNVHLEKAIFRYQRLLTMKVASSCQITICDVSVMKPPYFWYPRFS
jgi:hypothetical protein